MESDIQGRISSFVEEVQNICGFGSNKVGARWMLDILGRRSGRGEVKVSVDSIRARPQRHWGTWWMKGSTQLKYDCCRAVLRVLFSSL